MKRRDFPLLLRVLERMAPPDRREELVGDLLEEADLRGRAVGARRAHRWLRGECLRCLPSILSLRFRRDPMTRLRWLLAPLALVIATLQAWDSHVLAASPRVGVLVATSILGLTGMILFVRRTVVQVVGIVACLALLVAARVLADDALDGLFLVALFPTLVLGVINARERRMRELPSDDSSETPRSA